MKRRERYLAWARNYAESIPSPRLRDYAHDVVDRLNNRKDIGQALDTVLCTVEPHEALMFEDVDAVRTRLRERWADAVFEVEL